MLKDIGREKGKLDGDVQQFIQQFSYHYAKLSAFVENLIVDSVVEWAQLIASHQDATLVIIETTKAYGQHGHLLGDEPIRLTTLDLVSKTLHDYLFRPETAKEITSTAYNGITMEDLIGQPLFKDAWPGLKEQLADRLVIVFGLDYAKKAIWLDHTPFKRAFCLHNKTKEFYGEFYGLSLETVLSYQGINKTREELKESTERIYYLAQVIEKLAEGKPKVQVPAAPATGESDDILGELGDLSEHPF